MYPPKVAPSGKAEVPCQSAERSSVRLNDMANSLIEKAMAEYERSHSDNPVQMQEIGEMFVEAGELLIASGILRGVYEVGSLACPQCSARFSVGEAIRAAKESY